MALNLRGVEFIDRFYYENFFDTYNNLQGDLTLTPRRDTDPTFTKVKVLGDMKTAKGAGTFDHDDISYIAPFVPDPDGLGLIVNVANVTNPVGIPVSNTIYVVSPMPGPEVVLVGSTLPQNKFNVAPTLIAELEFDTPRGSFLTPNGPDIRTDFPTWAVALNFKSGDETDRGPSADNLIGSTCQFKANGDIHFNYFESPDEAVYMGTYDEYAYNDTQFKLRVSVIRTPDIVTTETSLTIDSGKTFVGTVNNAWPLTLAPLSHIPKITAAGVAVVNQDKDVGQNPIADGTASVRLRRFALIYG
jgi:hypothetical protein